MSPETPQHQSNWVERERQGELRWIGENLPIFWPAASRAFATSGRGALVVDTTSQVTPGAGNPFAYFSESDLEQTGDDETQRIVRAYDPQHEFVVVLLKSAARTSTYRIRAQPPRH